MIRIEFEQLQHVEDDFSENLKLISPVPQEMVKQHGSIAINPKTKIFVTGNDEPWDKFEKLVPSLDRDAFIRPDWTLAQFGNKILEWLNLRLSELGSQFTFTQGKISVGNKEFKSEIPISKVPEKFRKEAYKLEISRKKIEIISWTMQGAYYGIVTLMQLLEPLDDKIMIPLATIFDYPVYPARGLVDDISRGQRPTIENFKKFIRFLSRTKQNMHVLYLEDTFHFKSHPNIGKNRGRLEPEDIKEIQDYAKEWFVNIIPGVELLGHMENILLDPEYWEYAEFPGAQCIDTTNPKTKEFVRDLINDIAPVFESPIFAPICDESMDFGQYKSADYVKRVGFGKALAEWYTFLIDEINKAGKPVVFFAHDVIHKFKEALEAVRDKNAMIYCWIYADKKKYPLVSKISDMGLPVAGGPAVFDWSRHYPYLDYAEKNMINMGQDALDRGSIGLITTKWGDFGNENFRDNIYYGLQVNGQAAWSPFKSNVPQIRESFTWNFFGTRDNRIPEIMETLASQNKDLPRWPNGIFNRYWMDPFIRKIKKKEYDLAEQFIKESVQVLDTIDTLKDENVVMKNSENLDYMAFAAKMARHYGVKILVSEAAYQGESQLAHIAQGELGYKGDPVLGGLIWLKEDIEAQLPEYQGLWKRIAVEPGLEYPTQRFKILAWHYKQAIDDIKKGLKPHPHQLKAEWIWRPGFRLGPNWGNKKWQYFIKDFEVNKPVKKALLQGIAGNHIVLHLNGNEIGHILSRQSLGLLPLQTSVHLFNVTSEINEGKNTLCVNGANWGGGLGSINVILHLEYEDGSSKDVISDGSWLWSGEKPDGWPLKELAATAELKHARSYGPPPGAWQGPITEPVWETEWKSSTSFVLGNRNFLETGIPIMFGETTWKALFWLVALLFKPVVKLMGVDMLGFRKG